jgi:hypothetical protein
MAKNREKLAFRGGKTGNSAANLQLTAVENGVFCGFQGWWKRFPCYSPEQGLNSTEQRIYSP